MRVIDKERAIINLGSDDGVSYGMRFGIFTPETEITDPGSGDVLGIYREQKATVEVDDVHQRFSIVSPPAGFRGGFATSMRGLLGDSYQPELPVDPKDIRPLPTGSTVKSGDLIEQLSAAPGSAVVDTAPGAALSDVGPELEDGGQEPS